VKESRGEITRGLGNLASCGIYKLGDIRPSPPQNTHSSDRRKQQKKLRQKCANGSNNKLALTKYQAERMAQKKLSIPAFRVSRSDVLYGCFVVFFLRNKCLSQSVTETTRMIEEN
jgi:hypothetical protein